MMIVTSDQFATAHGMTIQVARRHFVKGTYRGEHLPLVQVPGQRGGKGGAVWALRLDACSDALRPNSKPLCRSIKPLLKPRLKPVLTALSSPGSLMN